MSFVDSPNQYHRTLIEIHTFDDQTDELFRHESELVQPPCQRGGCRASSYDQEHCEFDPKTGLCGGRMA